ncbi:AAA family ATPase [Bacillus sp. SCS-151]|uniref:AAA family ATPase n=1 Tax=Nanhaiella sioensis TaxID=3115293 RepID=UPI003979EB8A
MARKFGKKNKIKVDPLAYNLGLIGESGIGKTTLAVDTCEKLVGTDGYLILNFGKEDGVDAIPNAMYEDVPEWDIFEEIVDDIIENRNTDYKDLRVLVYDTFDELMRVAEPEVIRLHNKENPDKKVKSIKAAFGGFQAGEDKAIDLVLDKMWALKRVGISMFVIGHTKRKSMTDLVTGQEYEMLTTNMSNRYFNAIKTKLHVLGVASINRDIEEVKVKQKIGKDKTIGNVLGEQRIITFRDDNFNIDSKSRFSDITSSVSLTTDEFIGAIEGAIKSSFKKQGSKTTLEEEKIQQEKEKQDSLEEELKDRLKSKVNVEKNVKLIEVVKERYPKASDDVKKKVKSIMDEYNIQSFKDAEETSTEGLQKIVNII